MDWLQFCITVTWHKWNSLFIMAISSPPECWLFFNFYLLRDSELIYYLNHASCVLLFKSEIDLRPHEHDRGPLFCWGQYTIKHNHCPIESWNRGGICLCHITVSRLQGLDQTDMVICHVDTPVLKKKKKIIWTDDDETEIQEEYHT